MRVIRFALLLLLGLSNALHAQARGVVRPAGMVALPYNVTDNAGNQWQIYQQGWMRQQGNTPMYGQAAVMVINGNPMTASVNQARLDDKTGEIVFEGLTSSGVNVVRRILLNRQDSYLRYIDILKNPSQMDMSVNVQYTTSFNLNMQSAQAVMDPRNKDRAFGVAVTLQQGRTILEAYAGKGAKIMPMINPPQNNNMIQTGTQVTIPAGRQVALFHLHGAGTSLESAVQFLTQLKESQVLSDVPLDLRKQLVNISSVQAIGDREVLRGDLFDIVELRGGDQLKGTLPEKSFKLQTTYGPIELPVERLAGMINVGQFRPRQLLVTVDGEVFGGTLGKEAIALQLSSGQTTQIPLTQILRFGYRNRSGEPEEWIFNRPMIHLRSGERMSIAMPTSTLDVMTRYGTLKLKPETIASISLQSEQHAVHDVLLVDGSRFSGIAPADHYDVQLVGTASQQNVSFPASAVSRLQLSTKPDDAPVDLDSPTLGLTNDDELVGALTGQLKLDTAFDLITINASEVRTLTHAPEAGLDVQITLWDQTTLSGQLRDSEVVCGLKCGVSVKVPIPLIERYNNPQPRPSNTMLDRVKAIIAELNAEDWKKRESAEAQLVSMGPMIVGILKELSGAQSPEAQQRIDSVLKQLEKPAPRIMPVGE